MKADMTALFQTVEEHKERILAAERYIWEHPEPGYREWTTHAYMKAQFEELGYQVTEAGNIPGFYTDLDTGRPGPKIAIFAEMDSLIIPSHPEAAKDTGYVHACGHNCQCAAMLGVAAAFRQPHALDGLSGSIRLILVPAEELIELNFRRSLKEQGIIRYFGGKQEFMYRGILDGVAMSMMVHTAKEGLRCMKGSNGCVIKEAAFLGKSAHAGGAPQNGINALYAANLGMQAANALRETFMDQDRIRFHPIITQGGDSVNAIPDHVAVESYLRGATVEAIGEENQKVNRAFAGAAAAMGCRLQLRDLHGYSPRLNDPGMKQVCGEVARMLVPEEQVTINEVWTTGCSDMGDVSCVMPALHPHVGGAIGAGHSPQYQIADPYLACVVSAKWQVGMAALFLQEDAKRAKQVLQEGRQDYPAIPAFLASLDRMSRTWDAVTYEEDGTVKITY